MKNTITPTELERLARGDKPLKIIDVRTPVEFGEVSIAGAQLHPLDELEPEAVLGSASAGEPVYVVCRSGKRAAKAIEKLEAAGCGNAVLIDGGMLSWLGSDLPVVRGKKAVSLERQVRIAAGFLVSLGFVLGISVAPGWHVLSGFVGAGLMFAGITDTCAMGMAIAKMPWNRRRPKTSPAG